MTALLTTLGIAVGVATLVVGGLVIVVVLGLRTRHPGVLRAIRRFNKAVTNRRQLHIAGQTGAEMSVLHHQGRKSGREYATPIGAMRTADGTFVVALPYGLGTDWHHNLRAAGSAVLQHDGHDYRVDQPEVVPIEHTPLAPQKGATIRLFNVTTALRLRARPLPTEPPAT